MRTAQLTLIPWLLVSSVFADQSGDCREDRKIRTTTGTLTRNVCRLRGTDSIDVWRFNETKLIEGPHPISREASNEDSTVFVLSSATAAKAGCADRLYLIDATTAVPKVFSFGIKNGCNEYHWARWSKTKRSVIALKYDVRFTYVQGKLIPPDPDDSSEFGRPLSASIYADAKRYPEPFVQELSLSTNR